VAPSWYGDSVGHYEGDTLVIDTVAIKIGPFAMADMYGTPHSPALHVVERYRPLDYEATKAAAARDEKENFQIPPRGPADGVRKTSVNTMPGRTPQYRRPISQISEICRGFFWP
jgi:hypothetical protein